MVPLVVLLFSLNSHTQGSSQMDYRGGIMNILGKELLTRAF